MTEAGYVKPGNIVFGTDSHTTTYGCVGAFSSGIGYTEMASILGTGTMWIKVPETIKVVIDGELPENVMSKDVILRLIGDLGADGATYRALEFTGSAVKNMSVASRMTIAKSMQQAIGKFFLSTECQMILALHRVRKNRNIKCRMCTDRKIHGLLIFVHNLPCHSQITSV